MIALPSCIAARLPALAAALLLALGLLPPLAGCSGPSASPAPAAADASAAGEAGAPVVLARYADETITLDAFERRYVASAGVTRAEAAADSLPAYEDFLTRYLHFRLKIHAARAAGMHERPGIRQEVAAYRAQMARPTLLEDEVVRPIARLIHERKKEQVDVSHILIKVETTAPPADTLAAYERIAALRDSLAAGADFGALAQAASEDPSAQRVGKLGYRGRLGFLTGGQTVKAFEDAMYETPTDSVSGIVRSQYGYHLVKVHGRRAAEQPVRLAHILVRPDSATAADTLAARQTIDSLQTLLAGGADFADLARRFSAEPRSARRGGDLGFMRSTARLDPAFREAAFALDAVGDMSDVVTTRFGFHLIKLLERQEPETFAEAYDDLKSLATRLPRTDRAEAALAQQIRTREGVTVDTAAVLAVEEGLTTDSLARRLIVPGHQAQRTSAPFATLGDSSYTVQQLARFVIDTQGLAQEPLPAAIDAFLDEQALDYEAASLEARDPAFRALIDEYREGLLLFEFMQDSVWAVAERDTAALRALYEAEPAAYRFPERARVAVLASPTDSVMQALADTLRAGMPADAVVAEAHDLPPVTVDTVVVTREAEPRYQAVWDVPDGAAAPLVREGRQTTLPVRLATLPARPKTFAEARSALVRDYQERYEQVVEARLRRRYDAETFPDRLARAFADAEAPTAAR